MQKTFFFNSIIKLNWICSTCCKKKKNFRRQKIIYIYVYIIIYIIIYIYTCIPNIFPNIFPNIILNII